MLTLNELFNNIKIDIKNANKIKELEQIRIKYLGKKSIFNTYMRSIKDCSFQEKKIQYDH